MNSNHTYEDLNYNKNLKKAIFEVLLEKTETFYIHCVQHTRLHIGSRGLIDQEKKDGIILVFGPYSYRNINWDENEIYCEMNFGKWEQVIIPFECIFRIFDKAGHVIMQFLTMELEPQEKKFEEKSRENKNKKNDDKIIEVDFNKKKKKEQQ